MKEKSWNLDFILDIKRFIFQISKRMKNIPDELGGRAGQVLLPRDETFCCRQTRTSEQSEDGDARESDCRQCLLQLGKPPEYVKYCS